MPKLSTAGLEWAIAHPATMVARIALAGDDWPESHRDTAIRACNKAARKDAAAVAEYAPPGSVNLDAGFWGAA